MVYQICCLSNTLFTCNFTSHQVFFQLKEQNIKSCMLPFSGTNRLIAIHKKIPF